MKETINFSRFCDSFGEERKNQFSYEGKKSLFEYLEKYEEDTGEELELDPIAFCCDYTEYKDLKEFQDNYGDKYKTIQDIKDNTIVIPINKDSFIIQNF